MNQKQGEGPNKRNQFESLELEKRIELYRKLREHEDNVKNHRMGWMWALQGLLLTALSILLREQNGPPSFEIKWIMSLVELVGFVSVISIGYSVLCSSSMLEQMEKAFSNAFDSTGQEITCLQASSFLGEHVFPRKVRFPSLLPWKCLWLFIAVVWALLLFLTLTVL